MLLGLVSNPGLLATHGLNYDHRFINKQIFKLNSKKTVRRERIRLTSLEVWAVVTAKV